MAEQGGDIGFFLPGTDNILGKAFPQHAVNSGNKHSFSRAGFPGKHVEGGAELNGGLLYYRYIFNIQLGKHGFSPFKAWFSPQQGRRENTSPGFGEVFLF